MLLKPTFQVPHGGGQVLKKDSPEFRALLTWLKDGAQRIPENEKRIVALRVTPAESVLLGKDARRKLLVTARYSDGTERDITRTEKFESNDDSTARVTPEGVLTAERGGETAIGARAGHRGRSESRRGTPGARSACDRFEQFHRRLRL